MVLVMMSARRQIVEMLAALLAFAMTMPSISGSPSSAASAAGQWFPRAVTG